MENSTYPGSEKSNFCSFRSNTSQELDFVDHWVESTIEDEVSRGTKLRDEKSRSYVHQKECKLVDINKFKYPYMQDAYHRTKSQAYYKTQQSYCYDPQASCSPPRSPSLKAKCAPRCPLRIAELAVPTKRQCIETWRTKCDILPPIMVERLKQQVMDERPIVQITDAVNCFKRAKPKSTKSSRRHRKFIPDNKKLKNEKMLELRKLCAIFGKKIAQKLITPQNLKLNPELDKIAKIVADELAYIMRKEKISNIDDKIHAEISDKIAVWIAIVLEDTSYKLLEEDLRELEEEEGPVLDFIDDVIDSVMNICNPQAEDGGQDMFREKSSHTSGEDRNMSVDITSDPLENNKFDESTSDLRITSEPRDITVKNDDDDDIKTEAYMQDEINKIINYIFKEDSNKDEPKIELFDEYKTSELVHKESVEIEQADRNGTSDLVENESAEIKQVTNNETSDLVDIKSDISAKVQKQETSDLVDIKSDISVKEQKHETSDLVDIKSDISELVQKQETSDLVGKESISNILQIEDQFETQYQGLENKSGSSINRIEELESISQAHDNSDKEIVNVSEAIHLEGNTASNTTHLGSDNINVKDDLEQSKSEHKVSDVFGMVFAEEYHDDKNKKVLFSDIDLGNRGINQLNENGIHRLLDGEESNTHLTAPSTTSENINPNIVFAPPNENLLSDADELWPADVAHPTPKVTTIISRSVTSLGNIAEKEEKLSIILPEIETKNNFEDISIRKTEDDTHDNKKNVKQESSENKNEIDDQNIKNTIKSPTKPSDFQDKIKNGKIYANLNYGYDNTVPNLSLEDSQEVLLKSKVGHETPTPTQELQKDEHLSTNRKYTYQKGIIGEETDNNQISGPKFDYKVNFNTAPSWLSRDHGKGEPSEDSIERRNKDRFKENELRIWCKDLDLMFANLDLWNSWLKTTYKNILFLKQRGDIYKNNTFGKHTKRKRSQEWITLKKNIEKDAKLWTNLNYRAYKKLKTYKARIIPTDNIVLCDCKNNFARKKL